MRSGGEGQADAFARRAAVEFGVFIGLSFLASAGIGLALTEAVLKGALAAHDAPERVLSAHAGMAMIAGLAAAFGLTWALGGALIVQPYLALRARERAAAARAARAGRLALVARRASDMVLILDSGGRVEWANDAFLARSGLKDASGLWPPDLLRPTAGASLEADFAAALLRGAWEAEREVEIGGEARLIEIRMERADGAGAHIVLMRDITERNLAERRLCEAANLMQDALTLFDERGRLLIWNRAYERLLGAELHAGMSLEELAPIIRAAGLTQYEDGGEAEWAERQLRRFRKTVRERLFTSQDGGAYILRASPLKSGGFAALRIDVSELERARVEAQSAAQLKSSFLANITHEVRTPLNGVIAMAELLLESDPTPAQRAGLELISRSGHALLSLIGDILDFARIDAGRMPLEEAPFDPVQAVEDAAAPLALQAWRKGLDFRLRFEPDLPGAVIGDAGRFRQIVVNLVGNAIKFTAAGRVECRLRRTRGEGGARLVFEVEDEGPGVPPERLEAIFRPFEQGGAAAPGAGLGLSIARRLAELMGGALSARSTPGLGSVFTLDIGLVAAGARARPLKGRAARVLGGAPGRRAELEDQLGLLGADRVDAGEAADVTVVALDEEGAEIDDASADDALVVAPPGAGPPVAAERILFWPVTTAELGRALVGPTVKEGARPPQPPRAKARRGASGPPDRRVGPGAGPTVLVVEDNATNQTILSAILEREGLRCRIAETAAAAVETYRRAPPSLTFMDLRLPDGDGAGAARRIRGLEARQGWPRGPIIAMSADVSAAARERAREAGMEDFIAKPLDPSRLRAALARWLDEADRAAG